MPRHPDKAAVTPPGVPIPPHRRQPGRADQAPREWERRRRQGLPGRDLAQARGLTSCSPSPSPSPPQVSAVLKMLVAQLVDCQAVVG